MSNGGQFVHSVGTRAPTELSERRLPDRGSYCRLSCSLCTSLVVLRPQCGTVARATFLIHRANRVSCNNRRLANGDSILLDLAINRSLPQIQLLSGFADVAVACGQSLGDCGFFDSVDLAKRRSFVGQGDGDSCRDRSRNGLNCWTVLTIGTDFFGSDSSPRVRTARRSAKLSSSRTLPGDGAAAQFVDGGGRQLEREDRAPIVHRLAAGSGWPRRGCRRGDRAGAARRSVRH